MIRKFTPCVVLRYTVLAGLSAIGSHSSAEQSSANHRHYQVDATVISLDATHSLASYRSHGSGGGSPGSTLLYSTPETKVHIDLTVESDRFYADVATHGEGESEKDDAQKRRIDLTNLRPTFLDLGADKDGRSYQLNLVPSVVTVDLSPISFQKAANDLYRLRFHSSRILLNDTQYIGRMLATDGEVFTINVCGVTSLEFSLHRLKNGNPWGRLKDGHIILNHPDGTSLDIGNVTNGEAKRHVDGGPFVVWVRWGEPQQTFEEYRSELLAYRKLVANGKVTASAKMLATVNKELAREPGPWVTSTGARDVQKGDIVGYD